MENLYLAHKNARKGKAHYTEVKMVDSNPDYYLRQIHEMLKNKTYKTSPYEIFTKIDKGKEREIYKLPYYPDRIVHWAIVQIIEPIWMKTFIYDTYSSLKGRGIHKGLLRLHKAMKDKENTQYCLKFDIKKFYPSINHRILKQIIRKKIKDKDLLWLLDSIIDSVEGETNVPIGNYLSQYFGNLYLTYFDHYLYEKLILKIKENWQVFPTYIRGVDFLGYRSFGGYTLLRKSTAKTFKRKMRKLKKKESLTDRDICSIMSYKGWLKWCDGYNLEKKYIEPLLLKRRQI